MAEITQLTGNMTLREMYPEVNANVTKVNAEIVGHKSSQQAHAADAITYSGEVVGAATVKDAIDNVKNEVRTIVASAGDGTKDTEIVLARKDAPTLGDRLDGVDAQLAETKEDILQRGYDVRWNALMADGDDWTAAIQSALNNHDHVFIPPARFKITGLTINRANQTISGAAQLYTKSILEYSGNSTAINIAGDGYVKFENIHLLGVPTVSTDFYNTGSVGVKAVVANPSMVMENVWIRGFEKLVESNYNSYYNKFINCRFERSRDCLYHFADYNLEVRWCRFTNFHNAITSNGNSGPLTIHKNSFEVFNGYILLKTGEEEGVVSFKDNYVEIYDTFNLPTNFPNQVSQGALPGKFGGNVLFGGPYKILTIENNLLDVRSAFRIVSASTCKQFRSADNYIQIYRTGNNLNTLYSIAGAETYYIKDKLYRFPIDGPYNRDYVENRIPLPNPYNEGYFYDCVLDKENVSYDKYQSLTLQNGWVAGDQSYGLPRMEVTKNGLILQGVITGTNRTGHIPFTIPQKYRPFEIGNSKGYARVFAHTLNGEVVQFRYVYATGAFNLEGTPTNLDNVVLDGLIIPSRI